jgi:hypothetical protein
MPPAITPTEAESAMALERARAAYEYGEMDMVVDSARLVAEGRLHPTTAQRAQALRYLGIGLYLTDRQEGAETAFFDLLRLKPHTRLDATTTRPDVVAFFENAPPPRRRDQRGREQPPRQEPDAGFLLPFGVFQSGYGRAASIAALEVLSLGTEASRRTCSFAPGTSSTRGTRSRRRGRDGRSHADAARILKPLNYVSVAVLVATVVVGIIDGVASYNAVEPEDAGTSIADILGRGLRF